jgi:hypothetical protein
MIRKARVAVGKKGSDKALKRAAAKATRKPSNRKTSREIMEATVKRFAPLMKRLAEK